MKAIIQTDGGRQLTIDGDWREFAAVFRILLKDDADSVVAEWADWRKGIFAAAKEKGQYPDDGHRSASPLGASGDGCEMQNLKATPADAHPSSVTPAPQVLPPRPEKQTRKQHSDEEILSIIARKEKGESYAQIAADYDADAKQIYMRVFHFKKRHPDKVYAAKKKAAEDYVATPVPRDIQAVIDWCRGHGMKIGVLNGRIFCDGVDYNPQQIVDIANKERIRARLPIFKLMGA
ncbi:MAG: hypothetical protein KGI37_07655 [Alphaproteobacteria bacterium]|nr:hypothetical protein [Alphaproteobacteria bacterium]